MSEPTYETCIFFRGKKITGGQCRRFPPTVYGSFNRRSGTELYDPTTDTAPPWVDSDYWCGEHKERP